LLGKKGGPEEPGYRWHGIRTGREESGARILGGAAGAIGGIVSGGSGEVKRGKNRG
jgi:hypothetical protein